MTVPCFLPSCGAACLTASSRCRMQTLSGNCGLNHREMAGAEVIPADDAGKQMTGEKETIIDVIINMR